MPAPRSRRSPRSALFLIGLTLATALQAVAPVWAWGPLGHRVISRLAEKKLSARAKAGVAELLEPGESLADASLWPDDNVGRLPKTAPWHYVDVPLSERGYDAKFSGDVAAKGCVVDKINEFRAVVNNKSKSVEDRRFALRFLIHCIEDLHQPCHVGDNHDKGGNQTQVQWFSRGSNLHRVWDSGIIEHVSTSEEFWLADLADLDTTENRAAWMKGTVEEWATESLVFARWAYLIPGTLERLKPGEKLGEEYQAAHLPVARRRLTQAGLRLAWVLNEAFSAESSQGSGR